MQRIIESTRKEFAKQSEMLEHIAKSPDKEFHFGYDAWKAKWFCVELLPNPAFEENDFFPSDSYGERRNFVGRKKNVYGY